MAELMFVLKSFAFAVLLMFCLQVKVGSSTLEDHAQYWIHTSSVPVYLQKVASGAVLAIENGSGVVKEFASKALGSDGTSQKASRLNIEFKRSQKYQQEQAERN